MMEHFIAFSVWRESVKYSFIILSSPFNHKVYGLNSRLLSNAMLMYSNMVLLFIEQPQAELEPAELPLALFVIMGQ